MAALRIATRDLHERTDTVMGVGQWLTSPTAYATFLARSLRFHRLVEGVAGPRVAGIDGLDYPRRRRSPLIEADLAALAALGVNPDTIDSPPPGAGDLYVGDAAGALGCLYVVEGSTLGAAVLARWILGRLGYGPGSGASSFVPYGAAAARRWRAFGTLLDARALTAPGDLPVMLAAARATFSAHQAVVLDDLSPATVART